LCLLVFALAFIAPYAGGGGKTPAAAGQKVVVQIGYENSPGEPVDLAIHECKLSAFAREAPPFYILLLICLMLLLRAVLLAGVCESAVLGY
jgi:hypothetical protein